MPTYEYACAACNHHWEAVQSMKADALKDCPSCGQPQAQRQISRGTGFILKGGGWYSDLYSSTKPSGGDSGSGSGGSSASAASATSTGTASSTGSGSSASGAAS